MSITLKNCFELLYTKVKELTSKYLPLTGGVLTGNLTVDDMFKVKNCYGDFMRFYTKSGKLIGGFYSNTDVNSDTNRSFYIVASRGDYDPSIDNHQVDGIHGSYLQFLRMGDENSTCKIFLRCRNNSTDTGTNAATGMLELDSEGNMKWCNHLIATKDGLVKG